MYRWILTLQSQSLIPQACKFNPEGDDIFEDALLSSIFLQYSEPLQSSISNSRHVSRLPRPDRAPRSDNE